MLPTLLNSLNNKANSYIVHKDIKMMIKEGI